MRSLAGQTGGEDADILVAGELLADPLSTAELSALRGGASLDDAVNIDIGDTVALADDGAADTLDGGAGADLLYFGAGDTATGGSGADGFNVLSGGATEATITDFDSAEDTITIIIPTAAAGATAPVVTVTDDGADALILLDGTVVARAVAGAGKVLAADVTVQEEEATATFDPNPPAVVAVPV